MLPSNVRPELARRIVWEAAAIRSRFPGRFRLALAQGGLPSWVGAVPVEGREFPVVFTYPAAYPAVPPSLETLAALPPGCPHVLGRRGERSQLCWIASHGRLPRRRWDPQRHTAATVLRAGQRWGLAFLVWQQLGVWPVPDAREV